MLYYVGFNSYKQCPEVNVKNSPNIIKDWTCIPCEDIHGISCTHRFLVVEKKNTFSLFGLVIPEKSIPWIIDKPEPSIDSFQSSDECLIASAGINLWKFPYRESKWKKLNVTCDSEDEKNLWTQSDNKIVKISYRVDSGNLIILLNSGTVWSLTTENRLELLFSNELDKAVDLSSGLEHTLILTESGCVLSFGNGSRGQLGTGNLESIEQPVQISSLEGLKVSKINTGNWHSCAITDSGDLCTWGWNNFGQLAAFEDGEEVGLTALPVFVDVGDVEKNSVVDVGCGSRHTIAKLDNGDVYATGWNAYGQLGIPLPSSEKISTFTKINLSGNSNRMLNVGPWYTILIENQTTSAS